MSAVAELTKVVFDAVDSVSLVREPMDLEPAAGEVVLRTLCSCISAGTELAKLDGRQTVEHPFVPGNRAVGEVLAVGAGVRRAGVGDRVVAHTPHASHARTHGFVHRVPEGLDDEHACVVGLGLVAMTAVRVAQPELGDRAVVFGAGVVGCLCAQLLALSGCRVALVDISPGRLAIAQRCGIEWTVNAGEDEPVAAVLRHLGAEGAEIVVEATGNPRVFESACAVARRDGQVVLLGSPRGEWVTDITPLLSQVHLWRPHGSLHLHGAHEWQCRLYDDGFGKHSMARNAAVLVDLIVRQKLQVAPLVTHVIPPDEVARAYRGLSDSPDDWLGVVLDWRNLEPGGASDDS